jgi:hypothetical protein
LAQFGKKFYNGSQLKNFVKIIINFLCNFSNPTCKKFLLSSSSLFWLLMELLLLYLTPASLASIGAMWTLVAHLVAQTITNAM